MKRISVFIIFLCLCDVSLSAFGADQEFARVGYREEISLADQQVLVVSQDTESTVSVEISPGQGRPFNYKFTVGNATFITNTIKPLTIDTASESPEYFIEIFNKTSNYGGGTAVIIYKKVWWDIAIVPDDLFEAKDVDGDGIYEILGKRLNEKTFQFSGGVFREK